MSRANPESKKPLRRSDKIIPLYDFSICQAEFLTERNAVIVAPFEGSAKQ
jgi:hypothetical protein